MTTYYVSSEIGSDNNAGTSATAPLATLQDAANLVKAGDTVEVMNGTYTGNAPGGGDVLDITTSGTASAPITFEAAPGQTPVINSSGGWNGINVEASYIVISGFSVVGDAANYTLSQAMAGYSSGNANLDGNGIAVNSPANGVVPNHITIENNTVYNEPGGGIYAQGADYVQILNNVVYNNAHWSAYGNSGISIGASANSDTNAGVHDIVSGNLVYGNSQLVPTTGGNTITDGEGIILDSNTGFVGEILVENNTVYNNGSSGIESFLTNNAVITGNTAYGNDTKNVQAASDAQIFINQSNNNTVTNNTTTAPNLTPPAAPVISGDTVGFDNTVTLNGTAKAGSTITVFDNSTQLGTSVTNNSGAWMFTTGALVNGSQSFTATQTDSVGNVSPLSSPLVMTLNQPVNLVANGNFATGDFTKWTLGGNDSNANVQQVFVDSIAQGGSTYAAAIGSIGADGTISQTIATTPGQTYTLSFWLQNDGSGGNDFQAIWNGQALLSLTNAAQFGYKEYSYTVTATTSATTLEFSAANGPSQWDLDNISLTANGTSSTPPPAAPVISSDVVHSNDSVTLTGTAPAGSTVAVSDGGSTPLGTTTASSTGAWSYTTLNLAAGTYAFTATDTTSAGTSTASSPFDVTVTSSSPPPAAPVIKTGVANSNATDPTVTLTGTALAGSTVTVSDGGTTPLGTTTASSTGAWSYTTADLAAGTYAFTATDTTSAGTSVASNALNVTVPGTSPPPSGTNLVANGNFATGNFTNWTLGGNDSNTPVPQLYIDTTAQGGSTYAAAIGSMGADGTLSQTIATTAGQTYTLSFWLQNEGSTGNDFKAIWNGQTLLSLTNAAQFGYKEYTYTVTATSSTTTLEFSAANIPSNWDLDNISLTANGTSTTTPPAADGSTSLTEVANQYFLYNGSGSRPALKNAGAAVTAGGQFGAWTPIGAVQTASGYDVAWAIPGANEYTVWSTDNNGNYTGTLVPVVAGNSYALESIEPVFQQDLNSDGVIGSKQAVIQTDGSTSLTEVANQYFLYNGSGSGPALKNAGAAVTAGGQFGAWTPIGAVQTASGYDVAWAIPGANEYTVWTTDSNGNYTGTLVPVVAGNSYALESIEPVFQQDLNSDSVIGSKQAVIQTDGSTSLTEVANQYFLYNGSGSGPALKYAGAAVTAGGQFGAWTPIGAVQTASGYDVAWAIPGANEYTVWTTDSNGNYTGTLVPVVAGNSHALESIETTFNQDLNGDGVVGLYAAPGSTLQMSESLAGSSGSTSIGIGATLELQTFDSASVTFQGSTGKLQLDDAPAFSGKILNFTGNGTLSGSDQIDLKNINFNSVKDTYANGVLTVTDGQGDTAKLNFNGSYTLANFKFASDGSGGTIVYDPPVSTSDSQNTNAPAPNATSTGASGSIGTGATLELAAADSESVASTGSKGTFIPDGTSLPGRDSNCATTVSGPGAQKVIDLPDIAFGAQTTLGYLSDSNWAGGTMSVANGTHNANIALLGNYMASSFAMASDGHGGTMVAAEAAQPDQSLLSHPHHA